MQKKKSKKENNKKRKIAGLIIKIILTLLVVFLFGIWVTINAFSAYDNILSQGFNVILSILILVLLLILIWKESARKLKTIIAIVIIILVRIVHGYYYDVFSMRVEPMIHLQMKYGFNSKDLEIVETQKCTIDFITPGHNRSAKIKYNNQEIITVSFYEGKWNDNYKTIKKNNKENKKIYETISSKIKKYSNEFKVLDDLQIVGDLEENGNDYSAIIFLHSESNDTNQKIIYELNSYIAEFESKYLSYGLFIIKDLNFYNEMINKDISALNTLNTGKLGTTSPQDVFEEMKYPYERITFNHDGYNEDIFTNNGNSLDDEYKNPDNFKNIVFYYEAERNSFVHNNGATFQVFAIK